ncbi:hypothetical protein B296_00028987 [Ensete ventricosum]|uniref:RING-type E3 ubiquitin transferase n=1 Tax=Ensete ventricosum TaxID=4639 RepID=A0A426XQP7_ENSVE|nr:hypothetical protein B296_00028987 [Ensete ventricosum]
MAASDNQQSWVPYVPTRDCSMGFCSIYCPQWCYVVFPPPPPVEFTSDNSGLTFSPLVIVIIGILAGAFLLVCYYAIVSKYCGTFDSLRRWLDLPGTDNREVDDGNVGQSRRHETWHASPTNGLDEILISKIAVYQYRRGDGMVQGTDCAVCLSEFREDDSLRLLPKCSHAFHLRCIDTWLRSHSNCPLCRANIVTVNPALPPQSPSALEPQNNPEVEEAAHADETILVIEDLVVNAEEETEPGSSRDAAKDPCSQIYRDSRGVEETDAIVEIRDDDIQPMRRSSSMDASCCGRVSIADVLQMSMEDELLAAKENGLWVATSSSRRAAGDHSKVRRSQESRGLHGVMGAVPMKRSFSSGRFCLTRQGRRRNGPQVQEAAE